MRSCRLRHNRATKPVSSLMRSCFEPVPCLLLTCFQLVLDRAELLAHSLKSRKTR
jgi:hypothetical protein